MVYEKNRRNKYEAIVVYVVQSLIVTALIASVGIGYNSRVNSASIDILKENMDAVGESIKELTHNQYQTSLINATQTQQLKTITEQLQDLKQEVRYTGRRQ